MFIPESVKKEAMRAVKKKIKEELVDKLTISCNIEHTDDGDAGVRVNVELMYDGETISKDTDHVYL